MPSPIARGAAAARVAGEGVAGGRGAPVQARRERLASLKDSLERVAARLRSDEPRTTAQRSVLVARFNDLKRQVNLLDGLVAGEGQEARSEAAVAGAQAPAAGRPNRGEAATDAAVPTNAPPAGVAPTGTEGRQLDVVA